MSESGREPLSHNRVVEAAVVFIERNGLEALSMRKLATELGYEAMSLYNHVANKQELHEAIVIHVLSQVEVPDSNSGDWQVRLRQIARGFRAVGTRYPESFRLATTHHLATPTAWLPLLESFVILQSIGLDDATAADAYVNCVGWLIGFVLNENANAPAMAGLGLAPDVLADESDLRRLVTSVRSADLDRQFELGVSILLSGIQSLVEHQHG